MEKNSLTSYQPGEKTVVVYRSNDDTIQLEVQLYNDTVWLTQAQMAMLFGTQRQSITKHIKNIFECHELEKTATSSILELVQREGNRDVRRNIVLYNLDVIISVGYRVNTPRGIEFRQWANKVLKNYILKGYAINQRFERLEQRVANTEEKIDFFVKTSLPPIQGVFYDGQIFDAYIFVSDLIRRAKSEIILIDNYIDETVLTMLNKRNNGVKANIYTANISKDLKLDLQKHNSQYQPIDIKVFKNSHDRFLIIDDEVYHIGASLKDLGKKMFAFSKLNFDKEKILHFC